MALSEHEQKILAEIAEQFERDDPRLASKLGAPSAEWKLGRHLAAGVFAWVVGCLVLLTGLTAQVMLLGVIGFVVMSAGTYVATRRIPSPGLRNYSRRAEHI